MEGILEILGKIGFDSQVALANLINFLIIFFILQKFAFKPIKKIIDERQKKISEGLSNAKKAEADLIMAESRRNEIIKKAENDAGALITEAMEKGDKVILSLREKAKMEASKIMEEALRANKKEKEKMGAEFKEKSVDLIISSAETILKEKIDGAKNEEYIKKLLKST